MKFGVFGKGRLGGAIVAEAGTDLAWCVTRDAPPASPRADAAIEVSVAAAVAGRVAWAIESGTPLVIGSTGWDIPDLAQRVDDRIGVLVAPNFSLTVALYARLTAVLARFAQQSAARDPYIVEHHHARKHDAPSGTAKLLADTILAACPKKTGWVVPHPSDDGPLRADQLSVSAVRAGSTYSSHIVGVDAPGEVIQLHHEARSAQPYAQGALTAARWLADGGRRGVFSMDDVAQDLLDPLFAKSPSKTSGGTS